MLEIYLISADKKCGLYISEGDGLNLFPEDEAEGFKDYWYWNVDDLETGEPDVDGGTWLTEYLIPERFENIHDAIPELEKIFNMSFSTWTEGERPQLWSVL